MLRGPSARDGIWKRPIGSQKGEPKPKNYFELVPPAGLVLALTQDYNQAFLPFQTPSRILRCITLSGESP